jgi:hypothetical protein
MARGRHATFSNNTNCIDARFSGSTDFSITIFKDKAEFFKVTFSSEANFHHVTFSNKAHFSGKFEDLTYFNYVTFENPNIVIFEIKKMS